MAPCKVNFYQPSRQNRDQSKVIINLRLWFTYTGSRFCNLHLPWGRCHFQKTDPKTFSDLNTHNLKIVSISNNQKKLVKCFFLFFQNLETNSRESVSFVSNLEKNSVKERYFILSMWLLGRFDIANIERKSWYATICNTLKIHGLRTWLINKCS